MRVPDHIVNEDGSRRAKTLRNRFRAWNKYRMRLVAYAGVVWPRDISDFVNYVEEMLKVGAPISLHGELQASLVLLEQVVVYRSIDSFQRMVHGSLI